MIELFDHLSNKDVNTCLVILAAAGIAYRITGQPGDWTVWVDEENSEPAIDEVGKYFQENKDISDETGNESSFLRHIQTGLGAALIFLVVQVYINHHGGVVVFSEKYGASASAVLDGEIFRTITALMIHADAVHLISNMAALVLLFTTVCSVWGSGAASFCLLASGAIGNYLTALIYRTSHISIGSSTAVFGALGMLIVHRIFSRLRHGSGRMKAWLPIGAGLCLLGLFSEGAHTDILAHLFGLGSGMVLGAVLGMAFREPPAPLFQYILLSVTAGVLVVAWLP